MNSTSLDRFFSLLTPLTLALSLAASEATAQRPDWDHRDREEIPLTYHQLCGTADGGVLVAATGLFPINDNDTITLCRLIRFSPEGRVLWQQTPVTDRAITPVDMREIGDGLIVIGMVREKVDGEGTLWRGRFDHGGELLESDFIATPPFRSLTGALSHQGAIMIAGRPASTTASSRDVLVGHIHPGWLQMSEHHYTPASGETTVDFVRPLADGHWMVFGESYDSLLRDQRAYAWRLSSTGRTREFIPLPWLYRAEVDNIVTCTDGAYTLGVRIAPQPGTPPGIPHLLRAFASGEKLTLHQLRAETGSRIHPVGCDDGSTIAVLEAPATQSLIRIDLTGRITGTEPIAIDVDDEHSRIIAPSTVPGTFFIAGRQKGRAWLGRFRMAISNVAEPSPALPSDLDLSSAPTTEAER